MAINLLDENTINKIAAGEVVDRPSSVVKELVENAIDAGAGSITIEIKDGGISMIRITDNGCGIRKEDIRLAFCRHSTSKIKSAEDLAGISSLGFRGEALSSICAVSQVELITKSSEELTGIRYCTDGGTEKSYEEVGAPDGTTFIIRNLFYNTPARRKFLKSSSAEGGYISSLVENLCLSHPEISVKFINNNRTQLVTAGNNKLKDVIYAVYGREIAGNLLEVNYENENFKVSGYIGKPFISRGNRNYENYFINGRYIKNKIISKAAEDAYAPFIMQHKYPFTAFHITIKPELLDVNVHPSKMELRFSNEQEIYDGISECIKEALTHKEMIPEFSVKTPETVREMPPVKKYDADTTPLRSYVRELPPEPFEKKRSEEFKENIEKKAASEYGQLELFDRPELLKEENTSKIKITGQIFDTYWIIEFENNMYIIDQHAAHEKVLYERFMKLYKEQKINVQNISPPVILTLSAEEQVNLKKCMDYFKEAGYEIEEFGGNEYAVRGIPAEFSHTDPGELVMEIIDSFPEEYSRETVESVKNRIATMSCKAAVKGNNRLSHAEAERLIGELMNLENPYNCPHGRPTMITMSKYELEKKFKRII